VSSEPCLARLLSPSESLLNGTSVRIQQKMNKPIATLWSSAVRPGNASGIAVMTRNRGAIASGTRILGPSGARRWRAHPRVSISAAAISQDSGGPTSPARLLSVDSSRGYQRASPRNQFSSRVASTKCGLSRSYLVQATHRPALTVAEGINHQTRDGEERGCEPRQPHRPAGPASCAGRC